MESVPWPAKMLSCGNPSVLRLFSLGLLRLTSFSNIASAKTNSFVVLELKTWVKFAR
jgi:hypothetical protein